MACLKKIFKTIFQSLIIISFIASLHAAKTKDTKEKNGISPSPSSSPDVTSGEVLLKFPKNEIPPVTNLVAEDMPYDSGQTAILKWDVSPADTPDSKYQVFVSTYQPMGLAFRSGAKGRHEVGWIKVSEFPADKHLASQIDLPFWAWKSSDKIHAVKIRLINFYKEVSDENPYYFKVVWVKDKARMESPVVSTTVRGNWFDLSRLNNLILAVLITIAFFWTVTHAKRKGLFIRRIPGLDAIDEAIGRATEMGKAIFYIPGIGSIGGISTIASTFILGEVSKKVAQYDSQIRVPHYDPIVMTVCKEVVKQSYLEMGRPDSYRDDINFFVSSDQFSYAASVDGMLNREKPAACFFMGYFMAESLLLAEVGSTTGAIQIAGTDVESQLPFFFTACDYTLIGEELYAAGAYLSREPMLMSTLKVQDFGKLFVMVAVIIGMIFVSFGVYYKWDLFIKIITHLFKAY